MLGLNLRAFKTLKTGITVVFHGFRALPVHVVCPGPAFGSKGRHVYFRAPSYHARPSKLTSSMLSDSRPARPAFTYTVSLHASARQVRVTSMALLEGLQAQRCLTFSMRLEQVRPQQHDHAVEAVLRERKPVSVSQSNHVFKGIHRLCLCGELL